MKFSLIYDLIVANGWSHSHFGNSSDFGLNSSDFELNSLAGFDNSRFGNAHACNQICGCSSKCIGKISYGAKFRLWIQSNITVISTILL